MLLGWRPSLLGEVAVGRHLARHEGRAVYTSRHRSVLDPATSLRYALDDIGWASLFGLGAATRVGRQISQTCRCYHTNGQKS